MTLFNSTMLTARLVVTIRVWVVSMFRRFVGGCSTSIHRDRARHENLPRFRADNIAHAVVMKEVGDRNRAPALVVERIQATINLGQ